MTRVSSDLHEGEKALALLRAQTRRDGLNPRLFLTALDQVVEAEAWKHLSDGPITFEEFVARAGLDSAGLQAALKLPALHEDHAREEHERWERLRRRVTQLLTEPLAGHGGPRQDKQVAISNLPQGGTTANYTLRRLRRDHPELAARVDAGELKPNAAAIKAGFRCKTATVPIDTPEHAVQALLRRFGRDELLTALNTSRPT